MTVDMADGRRGIAPKAPAPRIDRARRAFELSLSGQPYRKITEVMKAEGYKISTSAVSVLIREYAQQAVLPLAKEHVTREFERLLEQRVRLEKGLKAAWAIHDRRHVAYSASGGIVRDHLDRTIRDDGPSVQALAQVRGFEDLILKNAEAMARLFGYNATVRTEVTVVTETDRAIADLVGELDARDARDTAPVGVEN
jgi:hypothetical protein